MALFCCRAKLVTYLPGLQLLVHRVAGTRSFSFAGSADESHVALNPLQMGLQTVWPDDDMELFRLQNQCCQLPDNVGFDCHLEGPADQAPSLEHKEPHDVLLSPFTTESHEQVLPHLVRALKNDPNSSCGVGTRWCFDSPSVECVVQLCPELLQRDFKSMFPDAPPTDMTVMTVTQRTHNDMTAWSAEVAWEREQMLKKFVEGAREICHALQRDDFWADFIDPSSGLAFFGPYTNNTMFETDERYRQLGFQIEDLGCCKAIRHCLWGTHVFVGTIFTNAPTSSTIMRKLQGN
ncbi:methylmalonic aciduria and homocystinuria type D homolog, mitochondrial-like isoform X1 [Echeneis naucrates]|uniref:methylmalonic aciduria and homocystinuria type D homolog, mitochondrial-like isoform X1 n=2 Tax=Echeneis naucrates TaxID=173247 RepID=UPI0011139E1A|nr:methylmalonic aciduria and homocystinuria type D homolog, mitochondrial-like isoform X1 [Echeneis naucrates]XP_029386298.1 methylmalonic aciduria and homocystinuria type D homolog, mitochondrial-like isoform X1 [Echeneis naucrates]